MKDDYSDITSLIDQEPTFYEESGVPRYSAFKPDMFLHAQEVALVEIQCQSCGKRFSVVLCWDSYKKRPPFSKFIEEGNLANIDYGHPPRHGVEFQDGKWSCYAGDVMSSESVKILEFWQEVPTKKSVRWKRQKKYEVVLSPWLE